METAARPKPSLPSLRSLTQSDRYLCVERIREGDRVIDTAEEMVRSATACFRGRFCKPAPGRTEAVQRAREKLLSNLRQLPPSAARCLEASSVISAAMVKNAINEMPLHKTPGEDGFPADWYRAFATEMAPLLAELYSECMEAGEMTDLMRRATVSLVYKNKGSRLDWKNYRPLSVSSTEYKVLTKCMQLKVDDVIQHVISPSQLGFQRVKYIGEATALVQLLSEYCNRRSEPGLMLLLDGEQAYDAVQHDWLQDCLVAYGFPDDFRRMVAMLYTRPELRMKVNGQIGDAFTPTRGVKQGCGLSPALYILSLQPLIDAIEAEDSGVPGVAAPGPLGHGVSEVRVTAYAATTSRSFCAATPALR